ncbi:putative short-chain dehydrogenase/reductase family 42E member 2 [Polyodon spathula]|nr:putative short-chain dehydrogenase/reductase family 42E member 2 [Polyodon spathula]
MELCSMKQNGTVCQVERFASSYMAQPNGSVCRIQGNGHPCTKEAKSPTSTKHRFSGLVPRRGKASACTGNRCVGIFNGTRTVTALVTGGGGYFGHSLGCALVRCGISVILLDLHKPKWDIPEGAVFLQSDIRDYGALYKVCDGVGCVFHVASYGMSGPEQLKKAQIESVNVGGTNNVIRVCKQRNITRLIYTSTVNVVFGGSPIEQGDEETVPYVPLDKHVDQYSKTKAIADQMVLAANGTPLKGGMTLRTCVLRPPGIYGPEERRHLQRVAVNIERRLFSFSFGNRHAKMNWVHIDNLVQAHLLAAEALTAGKGYIASGQIYYINDGQSVNLFEWLTPLFEKLGHSRPLIHLPVSLVYTAAILLECLHVALRPVIEIPLLLTRNEVRNIAVTHTFKIDKARRQLGFCPKQYSFTDSVDYYMKSRVDEQSCFSVCLKATLIIGSLLALLFLSCFWDDLSILKTSNETGH